MAVMLELPRYRPVTGPIEEHVPGKLKPPQQRITWQSCKESISRSAWHRRLATRQQPNQTSGGHLVRQSGSGTQSLGQTQRAGPARKYPETALVQQSPVTTSNKVAR